MHFKCNLKCKCKLGCDIHLSHIINNGLVLILIYIFIDVYYTILKNENVNVDRAEDIINVNQRGGDRQRPVKIE